MAANPVEFPSPALQLSTSTSRIGTVIKCTGRLTNDTTPQLKKEVKDHIAKGQQIVVDLSDVTYMDSMGLGTLVGLYVSAKTSGAELKLVNVNQRIKELLRLTKLANVFEGYGEHL